MRRRLLILLDRSFPGLRASLSLAGGPLSERQYLGLAGSMSRHKTSDSAVNSVVNR